MNREECENKILEKLKEIKDIVKEYDKSKDFYLSMTVANDYISLNNVYWETKTPLEIIEFEDGRVIRCD